MPFSKGYSFLTQGLNPHLYHLLQRQVGSLPLAPPRKPMLQSMVLQRVRHNSVNEHTQAHTAVYQFCDFGQVTSHF